VSNSFLAFLDAPFFGHGLGAVGQYLHDQYLGGRSLDLAASRPFEIDPTPRFFDPMNFTTELLASYGCIGTILYLYVYFIVIRDAAKYVGMASTPKSQVQLVVSIIVAVVVMFLWQNINQGLYRTYTWFFLGIADAIRQSLFANSQRVKFGANNHRSPGFSRSSISV
jgi:O-antigen ligase